MKLLKVELLDETKKYVFANVTYKEFWSGKVKTQEVYVEKYLEEVLISKGTHKSHSSELFGFETFLGFNLAEDIYKTTAIAIERELYKSKNK